MKKVIIFIGLKVAEISAIIFVPYYLGVLVSKWTWYYTAMGFCGTPCWIVGIANAVFLVLMFLACGLIYLGVYELVTSNWELSEKIANKLRGSG